MKRLALRYSRHCQGITQFYLHTLHQAEWAIPAFAFSAKLAHLCDDTLLLFLRCRRRMPRNSSRRRHKTLRGSGTSSWSRLTTSASCSPR